MSCKCDNDSDGDDDWVLLEAEDGQPPSAPLESTPRESRNHTAPTPADRQKSPYPPLHSASARSQLRTPRSAEALIEEDRRSELFGSNRSGAHRAPAAGGSAAASRTQAVVSENLNKAHQRGQKLDKVSQAAEDLKEQSNSFRDSARKLRQQQEEKDCVIC